jgi:hypothetical protein
VTIILNQAQSEQYLAGGWLAYEVEETILEDLDRQRVHEPVAVVLSDGIVAFYVTEPGVIL